MKKRIIAIMMAAAMAMSLTACGSKPAETAAATTADGLQAVTRLITIPGQA